MKVNVFPATVGDVENERTSLRLLAYGALHVSVPVIKVPAVQEGELGKTVSTGNCK